uniref:ribonuclease H n=1 Tax=Seriola dumerili TaxID=41447 RepID=A0A3B4U1I2_SERDU
MISHLAGRARAWAMAEWARDSPLCNSLQGFKEALHKTFDPVSTGREKARELSGLRQGRESVCDYAIRFRTLAAESGWNAMALYDVFLKGLAAPVQERLLPLDLPPDLDSLISLAVRTDNRLKEFRTLHARHQQWPDQPQHIPAFPGFAPCQPDQRGRSPLAGGEEPMQLGRAQLSQAERQRRLKEGRCFYCGESGHLVAVCPVKTAQVKSQSTVSGPVSRNLTSIKVTHNTTVIELNVLIDSGADESLMDWGIAKRLGLKTKTLSQPIQASALNGTALFFITHITEPATLTVDNHSERMNFYLFHSPARTLILGHPWLVSHNPHIDWPTGKILGWGKDCEGKCLGNKSHGQVTTIINTVSTHPVTEFQDPDLTSVPSCYHHLKEVFNKVKATSLPPHRPYDCAIELIPGSTIPKGRLYSVSAPERQAMKDYIESSLKAGLIRPSSSPAGAGFFFVDKKDGSLRPCIDYSALNDITIKNRYPLPLMSSVFDQLQQATVFTKLDLRNAYHLVRIREGDEWKTGFNTPSGHYEYRVMPFGLTNAPAVFQAMINDVLRDFLDQFVYVYLDDILIYSSDLNTHKHHVCQVLKRLLDNHLYVKAEKSEFHAD